VVGGVGVVVVFYNRVGVGWGRGGIFGGGSFLWWVFLCVCGFCGWVGGGGVWGGVVVWGGEWGFLGWGRGGGWGGKDYVTKVAGETSIARSREEGEDRCRVGEKVATSARDSGQGQRDSAAGGGKGFRSKGERDGLGEKGRRGFRL